MEMECTRVSRETISSEKRTSFENLFTSTTQTMILVLNTSSSNQVTASAELSDAAKEFFKQSNMAKAHI
eukprot:scaffold101813_cov41-Attheya_sp.AAC.1